MDWDALGSAAGTSSGTMRVETSAADAQASVGMAAPSHTSEGIGANQMMRAEQETDTELKVAEDSLWV